MNDIKRKIISLKMLLIITNISLMIMIVLSVTVVLSNYIRKIEYEHAMEVTEKAVFTIALNIEYEVINQIYEDSLEILYNNELIEFLERSITDYEDERSLLVDIFILNRIVGNTQNYLEDDISLSALTNNKDFMYALNDPYYNNINGLKTAKEMIEIENDSDIRMNWYPTQLNPFYSFVESSRDNNVVIVSENIMNIRTGAYVGKQIYTIRESTIFDVYKEEPLLEYGEISIMDEEGQIISHSEESIIAGEIISQDININDFLVFSSKIDNSPWTITAKVPKNYIYKGLGKVYYINLLFVIVVLGIGVFIIIIVSNKIVNPFKSMILSMSKVQRGEFDNLIVEEGCREVRSLIRYYNVMVQEINENILVKHELENKKKIAELDALFAQINPHFLYNTLESIGWKARKRGDEELEDMVHYLGRFFNLIVNNGQSSLTIKEELEHAQVYMNIQNIRTRNRYVYSVEIDNEEIYDYQTIKLILQPIIENAIMHGLRDLNDIARITVKVKLESDAIMFFVDDNGVGMTKKQVNELNQKLEEAGEYEYDVNRIDETIQKRGGVGLTNINQRIKLYYGKYYGITLVHKECGSEVQIKIPKIKLKDILS